MWSPCWVSLTRALRLRRQLISVVFVMRVIDHACFVPETHVFRLPPQESTPILKHIGDPDDPTLVREAVPPPFTLAKALWALSLFSSWRGIGWNFTVPLSIAARQHPYKGTSSRRHFVFTRAAMLPLLYFVNDASRTFMKYRASHFFSGQTAYDDLTLGETITYSLAVVARVWWILQSAVVPLSIACVLVGGYMGWESEFWAPWGWPPTFGSISELWMYPGLSTLWSRVSWSDRSSLMPSLIADVEQRESALVVHARLGRDRRAHTTSPPLGACTGPNIRPGRSYEDGPIRDSSLRIRHARPLPRRLPLAPRPDHAHRGRDEPQDCPIQSRQVADRVHALWAHARHSRMDIHNAWRLDAKHTRLIRIPDIHHPVLLDPAPCARR